MASLCRDGRSPMFSFDISIITVPFRFSASTALETLWRHQMETFSMLLALCAGNSPVTGEFPSQGQWRRALIFSLICAWINACVNNHEAGDLRCHCTHYDVIVIEDMLSFKDDSRFSPSQWETVLLCNDNVFHWLGTSLESVWPWLLAPHWTH